MTGGDGGQADDDGDDDVGQGLKGAAIPHQVQGLQAERRKRGEPPANPDHHEGSDVGGDGEAALIGRQRAEEADDEGAQDVDQDGAPGELRAGDPGDEDGEPGAGDAAERSAKGD